MVDVPWRGGQAGGLSCHVDLAAPKPPITLWFKAAMTFLAWPPQAAAVERGCRPAVVRIRLLKRSALLIRGREGGECQAESLRASGASSPKLGGGSCVGPWRLFAHKLLQKLTNEWSSNPRLSLLNPPLRACSLNLEKEEVVGGGEREREPH